MLAQGFGWRPQHFDPRDLRFVPKVAGPAIPAHSDLTASGFEPPIYNQGQTGSCVGNGVAYLGEFVRRKDGLSVFTPSRLMLYYDARKLEGSTASDSGCEIRDAVKMYATIGACPEAQWPFDPAAVTTTPTNAAYLAALKDRPVQYSAIADGDLDAIRGCLAEGYPVVFGATLFQSFMSIGSDGIVPTPDTGFFHKMLEQPIGGHCQAIVGHDDATKRFKVRNSWGTSWAVSGYEFMQYDYLANTQLCSDLWTIRHLSA